MDKDELRHRTKEFALRTMKLVDALPRSRSANAVANQLVRSGTSVASNYRAACRARSRAEFVAKIGVVEEEADESAFWLELVIGHKLMQEAMVRALLKEADELTAIMAASRISASRNSKQSALANRKSAI
ncbi:MAG TPA: four helix bundle protein [Terriglobia bacterium]|nr:four helix bundle protein [Terriglobia bacterium]